MTTHSDSNGNGEADAGHGQAAGGRATPEGGIEYRCTYNADPSEPPLRGVTMRDEGAEPAFRPPDVLWKGNSGSVQAGGDKGRVMVHSRSGNFRVELSGLANGVIRAMAAELKGLDDYVKFRDAVAANSEKPTAPPGLTRDQLIEHAVSYNREMLVGWWAEAMDAIRDRMAEDAAEIEKLRAQQQQPAATPEGQLNLAAVLDGLVESGGREAWANTDSAEHVEELRGTAATPEGLGLRLTEGQVGLIDDGGRWASNDENCTAIIRDLAADWLAMHDVLRRAEVRNRRGKVKARKAEGGSDE